MGLGPRLRPAAIKESYMRRAYNKVRPALYIKFYLKKEKTKMKKLVSVLLIAAMMFAMVACGGDDAADDGNDVAGGSAKVGLGITVSLSATAATEDADGNAQQDGTAAAVLLDSEGKIVKCLVDVAQNKMAFTVEGEVLDKDKDFVTKKNLKEEYGMGPVSPLEEGEWYQQIAVFEDYVVGMTRDDVANIATTVNDSGHTVGTDEALTAGCTMDISSFIEAVVQACDKAVEAGEATDLHLGIVSNMASSTDATEDEDGVAFSTSTYAATATDADGKITAALVDCTQSKITIGLDGSVVNVPETVTTKKDLKEDYGMGPVSPLEEGEWYQQIAAFDKYVVGMTKDDVANIATTVNESGHTVGTDEALTAGCTMDISDFIAAIVAGM